MKLDTFKQHALVVQINYENAFEIWDRAGAASRALSKIWGELEVSEGTPQQQVLKSEDLAIVTGFNSSVVSLFRERAAAPASISLIRKTYETWRDLLSIVNLKRVGTRQIFYKDFESIKQSNSYIREMGLVNWPTEKVFNQPEDSELNSTDVAFRFQDVESYALLRVKSENVKFHAELDRGFVDEPIDIEKNRAVIDFDRATTGLLDAGKFRIDEWITGCTHVLRRDIAKVIGG